MPDKTIRNIQTSSSNAKQPAGRWKASCAAGHDPATGAPIRRTAYGQTPSEAAERLADSMDEKSLKKQNALREL